MRYKTQCESAQNQCASVLWLLPFVNASEAVDNFGYNKVGFRPSDAFTAVAMGGGPAYMKGLSFMTAESMRYLSVSSQYYARLALLNRVKKLRGTANPVVRKAVQRGQKMHKAYKEGDVLENIRVKEFCLPSGKRIDFIDFEKKIIYELKPNNSRAITGGINQLNNYLQEIEELYGPGWKTFLDKY